MIVDFHSGNLKEPRVTREDTNYVVVSTADGTPVVAVVNYYGRVYVATAEDRDFADLIKSLGVPGKEPAQSVEKMLCKRN